MNYYVYKNSWKTLLNNIKKKKNINIRDTISFYRFQTRRSRRAEVVPSRQLIYASILSVVFAKNIQQQIFIRVRQVQKNRQIPIQNLNKRCQRITWAVPYSIWSPASPRSVKVISRVHSRLKMKELRVQFVIFALKKAMFIDVLFVIVHIHTSVIFVVIM